MSTLQTFTRTFGAPQGFPAEPDARLIAAGLDPTLPAGRYRDGFLDFFTGWYDDTVPPLAEWAFLVPPSHTPRTVVCRNAHGVAVLAELDDDGARLSYFDPLRRRYLPDLGVTLANFVDGWLLCPAADEFLDDSLWSAWRKRHKRRLPIDEGLMPIRPIPAGGSWTVKNFQIEVIAEWLQEMGPIIQRGLDVSRRGRR